MLVWLRKILRKPGQRFVVGQKVQHKELKHFGKVIKILFYDEKWQYKVMFRGAKGSFFGPNSVFTDYWDDWEIA